MFEAQCDALSAASRPHQVAVRAHRVALTYQEVDCRANQLARHLLALGAGPGDRIGLLLDHGESLYVAMLAVLKIRAVYVPLDPGTPVARTGYIAATGRLRVLLAQAYLVTRALVHACPGTQVVVMETAPVAHHDRARLGDSEVGQPVDGVAALIYPPGDPGEPEGVELTHAGICNFAVTAAKIYRVTALDRVHECLSTSAAGFSPEAIWVTWMVGASLVPKVPGPSPRGHRLRQFLTANRVTALCCTPGQLASLGEVLPSLRVVALSGQACPRDLLTRWRRPGRRLVSVYGVADPTVPAATIPVRVTADAVQLSGGSVTVHLTPRTYRQTTDEHLRWLLVD